MLMPTMKEPSLDPCKIILEMFTKLNISYTFLKVQFWFSSGPAATLAPVVHGDVAVVTAGAGVAPADAALAPGAEAAGESLVLLLYYSLYSITSTLLLVVSEEWQLGNTVALQLGSP